MISAKGGNAIPMTAKGSSASRPRWSPDGKFLSFLAARNKGKTQVWALNRLGGEAVQLTDIKQGVRSYDWAPDASRILLTIMDPKPKDPKKDKNKAKKKKPWVIDRLQFKQDYVGYLDNRHTHLYVFSIREKKVVQITSGNYDDNSPVWNPGGNLIAFVSNRADNPDASENTDIWIVSADNTDQGKTLLQLTTNTGQDNSPAWSPDGKFIAYITIPENGLLGSYNTNHVAVIPSTGGTPKALTGNLDRNAYYPVCSTDGRSVFFILEDSGEYNLASVNINGKNLKKHIKGSDILNTFTTGKRGKTAVILTRPQLPGEIFILAKKNLRKLTSVNDKFLSGLKLAEIENIHFKSKDGTEIEGFIYKPIGFDPSFKYPAILRIHGGPMSQYTSGFSFQAQLWAANGYVVVMTNPRGSTGYGEKFTRGILRSWGQKDTEDVIAGIDYSIEKGYTDPERLGVGGWSYGGILTNYVITKTRRFKGAVTGASGTLWRANYGHDIYQYWYEKEFGLPWENKELYEKLSPLNYVQNVTTPTLIIGGEKDWNCPILNSELLYQALKRLGVTTQLVVYPGEFHGISHPDFQKDRFERYLNWYNKYVKGAQIKQAKSKKGKGK